MATVLGLREQYGVEASLVTGPAFGPEGSLMESYRRTGAPLEILKNLIRPIRPLSDLSTKRYLTRLFREASPDIVHTHSGKAGFLGRLAAKSARVPVVIHSIHGPSFGPFQSFLTNTVLRAAERRVGRATTHFISVAEAMTERYLAAGIGLPEQYSLIRSGFNVDAYDDLKPDVRLQSNLGIDPNDFVIGKIARLFELKGHDELLMSAPQIIEQCPKVKFLLVGDGDWRVRLEQMAERLGIQNRIVFAGLVAPDDVPRYVGLMNILVHLSRREGLPRALAQALAAGRPVVSWDCDGAREICQEGKTGFLLKPGDKDGLTKAVTRLAEDESLRNILGASGRKWVRKHFTVEAMVSAQYELYERLFAEQR